MIKKVVFIGGNRFGELGPILFFIDVCREKNLETFLITDSNHLKYECSSNSIFEDELKKRSINFISVDKIDENVIRIFSEDVLIFSVNCHWIFKKDIIDLVRGRIINYHNSCLPEQKGAGCHSWRIMQGVNNVRLTFHHLIEQIDMGDIVYEKELLIPLNKRTLKENYDYISKFETDAFRNCLNKIEKEFPKINIIKKNHRKDFYWPKLNTDKDGWIDWSWSAEDIVRFCNAFDDPFSGASTYLNGERIRLKKVKTVDESIKFHPFQYGLIYHIEKSNVLVACKNGGIQIDELIISKSVNIRKGKRFYTDIQTLENAKFN